MPAISYNHSSCCTVVLEDKNNNQQKEVEKVQEISSLREKKTTFPIRKCWNNRIIETFTSSF